MREPRPLPLPYFTENVVINTALALAARGWEIFPVLPRDKRPACLWSKLATSKRVAVERWWRLNPEFNIGVAAGQRSGFFALDIDSLDAEGELGKLERAHTPLPKTIESITPRGRHLLFRWPGSPVRNSASRVAAGIDIRGDGGFIIVPPSIGPSGRRYAWSVDSGSEFAAAPAWLLARMAPGAPADNAPTPVEEWRQLVSGDIPEGTRDNSLARLAGYLLRRRIDPQLTLELLQSINTTHCRPALPVQDVVRIVNSIAGKELQRRHGHD